MTPSDIPGYDYGRVEKSPITDLEFDLLKKTVMLGEKDVMYLKKACDVLKDQVDEILDLWYGWVASNEHLIYYFSNPDTGEPIKEYLERVRARFGAWILDTTCRDYNREWLDYQYEVGLRHHRSKKGVTDGVRTVPHIPLRYLIAFIYPITATIKPFLAKKGGSPEDIEGMYNAWFKSVVLQVAIWSHPYTKENDW
ncbi:protogloblin ApPgb [Aeropyrum pernix K1]|uniref:Protogloblin ApPgb n=1 Tax=Aeropyrum pernix (strain ATCC 700893 / DSM 11879 / JCM 9820 / NBRC 100138 / K1) TaxID=272557 RepID=Q9YFF4_AERPE|nr:protoglobin domain-containing protein [Aeropyrum pernix]BAA79242.1 protogloblin ApPgb [Aeropyrum pernix K1]